MDTFWSILSGAGIVLFIVFFFGFCIFIHEFGHLICALWQGLYVEKFSIGFGKALFGFTIKDIKFVVSILPLGGYVSIPQLDPSDAPKKTDGTPLPFASAKARALTAFAGPLFNILFGFVLACVLWLTGVWQAPPSSACMVENVPIVVPVYGGSNGVDTVEAIVKINGESVEGVMLPAGKYAGSLYDLCCFWNDFPENFALPKENHSTVKLTVRDMTSDKADEVREIEYPVVFNPEYTAGLRKGDRITAFNGTPVTKGTNGLFEMSAYNESPNAEITVVRGDAAPVVLSYQQLPNSRLEDLKIPFFEGRDPLVVCDVLPNSPAELAGLKGGDQLLSYNGKAMLNVQDFLTDVRLMTDKNLKLCIARGSQEQVLTLEVPQRLEHPVTIGDLGMAFNVIVKSVFLESPAERAGLKNYDRLVKINGIEVTDAKMFSETVQNDGHNPITLEIIRSGAHLTITGIAAEKVTAGDTSRYMLGITLDDTPQKILAHPNPWVQFSDVFNKTARTLWLLFQPVTSFVTGKETGTAPVKVKHMSSFLGIFTMLWYSVQTEGMRGGLAFIVLITFGLAFANLLPLPVLDGGHILFAFIEFVIRRRLPQKFMVVVSNIFAVLLIALMLYITFNDVLRLKRIKRAYSDNAPKFKVQENASTEGKSEK